MERTGNECPITQKPSTRRDKTKTNKNQKMSSHEPPPTQKGNIITLLAPNVSFLNSHYLLIIAFLHDFKLLEWQFCLSVVEIGSI